MTPRILIIHTPAQLEDASSLVDLLEAALPLSEGAIQCSSLPGYTLTTRPGAAPAEEFTGLLDQIGAALALVDEPALHDVQFWFDAAAVWSRGKRLSLVIDDDARRAHVPSQLAASGAVLRSDRAGLIALIEDIAFDVGCDPRIGKAAQRALDQFVVEAPAAAPPLGATLRPERLGARAQREPQASYEQVDTVPPPPRLPGEALAAVEEDFDGDEAFEQVEDDDVEPVEFERTAHHSGVETRLTCEMSFDAGRALGECSFHRDEGGDFAAELDGPFGTFVDAAGGNWQQLRRLADVELWVGATDNLIEALPPAQRAAGEWFEIGFQYSSLRCIAEQGLPDDPEQRADYESLWNQAMARLRTSAATVGMAPRDIRRVQAQLENLIGPSEKRDYGNMGRALEDLRSGCAAADRGELQQPGRAAG